MRLKSGLLNSVAQLLVWLAAWLLATFAAPHAAVAATSLIRLVTENGVLYDGSPPGVAGSCTEDWSIHAEAASPSRHNTVAVSLTHIPSGSTITRLRGYGVDNEAGAAITFRLRRGAVGSNTSAVVATWNSITGSVTWASTITSIAIDHSSHTWWIEVVIPGGFGGDNEGQGIRVYTVGVEYTL